jgi:LuxR family transcriptional regulator, maltose regulon positive regulatory protein
MATKAAPPSTADALATSRGLRAPRPAPGVVDRPRLFALLDRGTSGPVTLVSAPAGSGKTMLLASWLRTADARGAVAWVEVERDETDATRFWVAVMDALRATGTVAPEDPLATLTPAPRGEAAFVHALLADLDDLASDVLLVLDDVHHLRSPEALAGLERLLARLPDRLRVILISRRDPKLGLHRLRLAGALTEVRAGDLGFTEDEAEELMAGAGVGIDADDVRRVRERTEGWAAGLRLAAMSLARHDDPHRFVAEFSGSERTVADYLVEEVLARQSPEVRDLMLRTSILERVNGPLADLLTGRADGGRLLHELEEANALVVAVDVGRTWFRYHHLLGDLLRLELRREAPAEIPRLHRLAAARLSEEGHAIEAIRHAQHAGDWELASELLGRHWVSLALDGEEATLGVLLAGLPEGLDRSDAEVATIAAVGRLVDSRWSEADALLSAAADAMSAIPPGRRRRAETALAAARLLRARRLGDMDAVAEVADAFGADDGGDAAPGDDLEALALMNLGIAESWILRLDDAETHLRRALAVGRRASRVYVEVACLGALGNIANIGGRLGLAEERLREAVTGAERAGWSEHPVAAVPCMALAGVLIERGRLAEAADLLARADRLLSTSPEPAANVGLRHVEGMLALAEGRPADALEYFTDGGRRAAALRVEHFLAPILRQWELRIRLRTGEADAVRAALLELEPTAHTRTLTAHLALHDGDPRAAAAAVAPVLAGEVFFFHVNIEIEALFIDGLARTELGDADGTFTSVERALARSETDGRSWIAHSTPGVRELLAAHPVHRTAHAAHLHMLIDLLGGIEPGAADAGELAEPLSERELAVLRFLPTNLSAAEIGNELYLSVHTVKTHMRKLYAKLDAHTRAEAVQRGRALGLLGRSRRDG